MTRKLACKTVWIAFCVFVLAGTVHAADSPSVTPDSPTHLRCEALENPVGLEEKMPCLSWELRDGRRGARQTAYQIRVATDPLRLATTHLDLWDSGKVMSDQSVNVVYAGKPLTSGQRCFWAVRVWDADGQMSAMSPPAIFETGLLSPDDWKAKWIGVPLPDKDSTISPLLRKEFRLTHPLKTARLYVTALGSYRAFLNGQRIGNEVFTPYWTDTRKRIPYQVYDVGRILKPGANALGAMLGFGWYGSGLGWNLQRFNFGPAPPRLLAQLVVTYTDNTQETITTDDSWKATLGPILRSEIYAGETYDARKEPDGWIQPGFDDTQWELATLFEKGDAPLVSQIGPPLRVTETLKPKKITEPSPGTYIFDMGQNMVGWERLKVKGEAGTSVRLRFAEILKADGTLYRDNLRKAEVTDTYTLSGKGDEVFEPHFTYHGFRYVEVTGFPGKPTLDSLEGRVAHSDAPPTLEFQTSSDLVNQIQHNIVWGQRGNLYGVPTDCPQRDERLGWMGDAQIFARTASTNMDMDAFYAKWMQDVVDAQSTEGGFSDVSPRVIDGADGAPAWGDAGIVVPWTAYRQYGDTRIIERNYDAMAKWIEYIRSANPDFLWMKRRNNDFGDWVPAGSDTPKDVIATAYFAYDADLLSKMAAAIGRKDDAQKYADLSEKIKKAFNTAFVTPEGRIKGETQTCYAMALYMGLLPPSVRPLAAKHLVEDIEKRNGHLSTGFIGTAYLLPALTDNGQLETAYRLLNQTDYPSWGYMIKNGATTIWERWDGIKPDGTLNDPGMNSFNHFAFGSVGEWLYRYVAGIDLDEQVPGFRKIVIRPRPGGGLTSAKSTYHSQYGDVTIYWKTDAAKGFSLNVTLPPNATGTVYLPASDEKAVTESGKPLGEVEGVKFLRVEDGHAILEVGAGSYKFETAP